MIIDRDLKKIIKMEREKEKARLRINLKHIQAGVSFLDWRTAYIDESVTIGDGTVIGSNVRIEGNTIIGCGCIIGNNSRIVSSRIDNDADIQYSIIIESKVGKRTKVGPFAYLRPNCNIGQDVRIGDFVEIKNSNIGDGSKAPHLAYIGDADVGGNVNLGCGVVFVNYDGFEKARSTVGDQAFVGCNVNLIAPVKVGDGAYVAAGTTITKDVPEGALCVGRIRTSNIEGWVARRRLMKNR
ncbi:MAG: UDP-N-acetylglucosamine diphosphorylase [Anaerovoracaceae bacterium]|jgi:bifunctional UDP-N-acetylglucosamine pyrophosphorylase/glucosamine-1-phosphate N-acetyltransferase